MHARHQLIRHQREREGFTRGSHDPSIGPDETDNREDNDDDDDSIPRSNLRPLDPRVTTVAGVELPTRGASTTGGVPPSGDAFRSTIGGAIESLSPTYWHAPTHPNSPSTSSLPSYQLATWQVKWEESSTYTSFTQTY